jgi:hypothetical protein
MDAAKDIHKEMLPIWAAFLCGYPLLLNTCTTIEQCGVHFLWAKNMDVSTKKYCPYGQHFFVDILCCFYIFCPQKTPRCSIVVHVLRGAAIL